MIETINKGIRYVRDPYFRFSINASRGLYDRLNDEQYIKRKWKAFYGTELDLDSPVTLCEKLQWLKLYYRKPEFTQMVDKFEAKQYVADQIGEEYVVPTLGVWNSFDEIDFNTLPESFVLKCTHDSGGLVLCNNKASFDYSAAKRKLERSLNRNYYLSGREWPYKHVTPRIIAEPLIEELGKPDSLEYKTTCFNGKVAFVTICSGIAHSDYELRKNDHFDKDFNKMEWYVNYKPASVTPEKPELWEEIISISEKLSRDIPYLRVDCYIIKGRVVFGEMTFYTWSGFMHFEPVEWDYKLGQMLELPKEKSLME